MYGQPDGAILNEGGNKVQTKIRRGIYRHYKGGLYEVSDLARHSESGEWLVVYRALYGDYGLWVRPLAMFVEPVATAEGEVLRFALEKAFEAT